ncbi:acyltransferase domain-containing protein [Kribbella sp.]|uniref:acyltransferase domain-containing protein n=1 Tax=Kribbella sp. TaxID=1871183 RepID=UPI002D45269F|nr:acyltransferase domain-containing protein [Kribbella sp.]HZX04113.1 acyltransferase domain-containing protein [Kribbella sp.]
MTGSDADVARLAAGLGLTGDALAYLRVLAEIGPPPTPVDLTRWTSSEVLAQLGLSPEDQRDTLANRPDPERDAELWWLLERCHHQLVQHMGTTGPLPPWPDLPAATGAVGRFLYVWAFLATLPAVRRYHADRGITDADSWPILAVLGAQMANRRDLYGEGGLHTQNWVTHHFRGAIYALDRLHFERQRCWYDATDQNGPAPGEPVLGLHIPEGRLTPESVDAALDRARDFFRTHYPDEQYRFATCVSWVLDPQLTEYLAADTNLIRFQQRFTLLPETDKDDSATVVEFLFKRPLAELDSLPRTTTLQRAVVDHIRAGRPWRFRTGWFPL